MSIPVDLDALRDELATHERPAYLATTGDGGPPHLVSTYLTWSDGAFVAECGHTSARNLTAHPTASLVVPPNEVGGHSLIIDARAEGVDVEARTARLVPVKAVLHRPAAVPGAGDGSCGHDCTPLS